MSKSALNWAKRQQGVTPPSRFVLWCLADLADHHNHAWPTWKHIHKETGLSRSAIYRALEELERAQLISVEPRFKANGMRAGSTYRLAVDNSPKGSPNEGRTDPYLGIHKRGSVKGSFYKKVPNEDPPSKTLSEGRMSDEHREQGLRALAEIRRNRGV